MGDYEAPEYYELREVIDFYQAEGVVDIVLNVPVRDGKIYVSEIPWENTIRVDTSDPKAEEEWKNAHISPGPIRWTPFGTNVLIYFHVGNDGPGPSLPIGLS